MLDAIPRLAFGCVAVSPCNVRLPIVSPLPQWNSRQSTKIMPLKRGIHTSINGNSVFALYDSKMKDDDFDYYVDDDTCNIPDDFNAAALKDFKCNPINIGADYWNLLSGGDDTNEISMKDIASKHEAMYSENVRNLDMIMTILPVVNPIFAFLSYSKTIPIFDNLIDTIAIYVGSKNWIPVDGGAYQAEIITPAV